jgi:hypothetical protein
MLTEGRDLLETDVRLGDQADHVHLTWTSDADELNLIVARLK